MVHLHKDSQLASLHKDLSPALLHKDLLQRLLPVEVALRVDHLLFLLVVQDYCIPRLQELLVCDATVELALLQW